MHAMSVYLYTSYSAKKAIFAYLLRAKLKIGEPVSTESRLNGFPTFSPDFIPVFDCLAEM